jgi:DNA recombination protein RmuC
VDDLQKLVGNNQDKITKNFGALEGTVRTKLENFYDKIKDENNRSGESLTNMLNKISSIERTLTGTKSRGIAGEALLGLYLEPSIKIGEVKKNLNIGTKIVEFAWKVSEGKYIPIDAKFPEIMTLVEEYEKSEDTVYQKSLSKKVKDKIAKEIVNIQKYQNQPNTIGNCILAVPPSVLQMSPELISIGKESNVYLSSYKDVIIIAHLLAEQHHRFTAEGDIGAEKIRVEQLNSILEKIFSKSNTIDKGLKQISNANDEIKDEVTKSKRI